MAHFYAHLSATSKSEKSISCSKKQSIQAHLRSWTSGVFVSMYHEDGKDIFLIYKTSGSSNEGKMDLIKQIEVVNVDC